MIPSVSGVKFISILTVGDVIDGYRMVGIPDGLGLFTSGFDRFTVIMNHELGGTEEPFGNTARQAFSFRAG